MEINQTPGMRIEGLQGTLSPHVDDSWFLESKNVWWFADGQEIEDPREEEPMADNQ